jgi:hypothetical protein
MRIPKPFGLALWGALFVAPIAARGDAMIYFGNDAQFGSSATNDASLQGFTNLEARWEALGVNTTITDVFSTTGLSVFFATAPTTDFTPAQVTALQSFLSAGGLFIISHDGAADPAMNNALAALGSSMQFGALSFVGTVPIDVVNTTDPIMQGFSLGDTLTAFSPGQVTGGGTSLAEYLGNSVIRVESVGGGRILAVADFDLLNNVTDDLFPDSAEANNHLFQDNLVRATQTVVPEPGTMIMGAMAVGVGLALKGRLLRRRVS